jgi:acyl dehydratase
MKPTVGDTLTPFRIESVSPDAMKDWAKFLHDPNPIHLDVEVVKAKGLGDKRINQGPANVAYIMNMLMNAFPGGQIVAMESRFVDNVWEDDTVETLGKITDVEDTGDYWRVTCETGLKAEGRDFVITGKAVVQAPKNGN